MKKWFGIVTTEHCCLRQRPGSSDGRNESELTDEIFSGWAVRVFPETEEQGWVKIDTHYGYEGYVWSQELRFIDREELCRRQDKERFYRIGIGAADLLDRPKVQGLPLELLLKNAVVELLQKDAEQGWSLVRTARGYEGYVHTEYLRERKDDDGYLLNDSPTDLFRQSESPADTEEYRDGSSWQTKLLADTAVYPDGPSWQTDPSKDPAKYPSPSSQQENCSTVSTGYFRNRFLADSPDEETLREQVAASAKSYLGVQYRWAGKSSQGLDCSGLVFMSYLENGVLIYRDAKIMPQYPVWEITREELKKGDLIFFPGHVAMYLGNGKYIHSTAFWQNPYVTINSLNPKDPDYREDLAQAITGCGSVFKGQKHTVNQTFESHKFDWQGLTIKLSELPGSVSMVYKNLVSGETFAYRPEERHIAASTIKLFLMAAVFQSFQDGKLSPDEKIQVKKELCVPSCGVLTYLTEKPSVSVRDLVELMIIVSDNTATNLLFDLVGEEYLNSFISRQLEMPRVNFSRKMFDAKKAALGIENHVTATDIARLLEKIYCGELVSQRASEEMYQILTHQRLNGKIPFYLHTLKNAPVIAHKTGEDSGITHDAAIIAGEEPFLLCFLGSEGTDVPAYERLMAETALEIYAAVHV